MTTEQVLLCTTDERGVTSLRLNRPERRNALDGNLMLAISEQLDVLVSDTSCRLLVLTGAGSAFCAGADFAWLQQVIAGGEETNLADAGLLAEMMQKLYSFPKPTIVLVNGAAYGGGAGMVACCDLALATEDAMFAFSEVRLGLVAAVIAPYVIQAIGSRNAKRLMLTGEPFGPQQALEYGLVSEVVMHEGVNTVLERDVVHLLAGDAAAQSETKAMLHHYLESEEDILNFSARLTSRVRASDAARKRMQQFLQRKNGKD